MTGKTTPIFIVGCGRSGTQALARMFASLDDVTMHHEYMIHHVQPLGAKYYHGCVDRQRVSAELKRLYGAAIAFSETPTWGDSSNKLSWFIDVLADEFPEARFIHIVRDGRKVVSSLYNKLGHECLDDRSNMAFRQWLSAPESAPEPPPEKKYWWPEARKSDPEFDDYARYDHFERIAFHWSQINRHIVGQLHTVSSERWMRVRLEDITKSREDLERLLDFAGCEASETQHQLMEKPHNVIRPVNYRLSEEQSSSFWRLAGAEMERFGYATREEYDLEYDAKSTGNGS